MAHLFLIIIEKDHIGKGLCAPLFKERENVGKGRKVEGRAARVIRVVIIVNSQFKPFRTPFTEN